MRREERRKSGSWAGKIITSWGKSETRGLQTGAVRGNGKQGAVEKEEKLIKVYGDEI